MNEKEIIEIIKKQQKVYQQNIDFCKVENEEQGLNWQRGARSTCNYIIQLIEEANKEKSERISRDSV